MSSSTCQPGYSSRKSRPKIDIRQKTSASHSVMRWWGVSSIVKSSQSLHDMLPGGGEKPWNTTAFWRRKNACPVKNRTVLLTISRGCRRIFSALDLDGACQKNFVCLASGPWVHLLVQVSSVPFSISAKAALLLRRRGRPLRWHVGAAPFLAALSASWL